MTPDHRSPLRLLIVSPLAYYPACGNGGGVLCFELLRRLGQACEVHFLSFLAEPKAEAVARDALQSAAASVRFVPWLPRHAHGLLSLLRQFLTLTPREATAHGQPAMRAAVREACDTLQPDLVLLQFPHMAQYVDACGGIPVVVDVQDACMVSRYREWRAWVGGMLRRALLLHTWVSWARYEVAMYGRAQGLMALSHADLGVLRAYIPQVPAFLSPVAWQVALPEARPESDAVVFLGNFGHAPNLDGLRWLLADVWPLVRACRPSCTLQVAGSQLPAGFADDPEMGVRRLGFVADAGALLRSAAISLVPYRFGGGIKIKAIESMAQGCAVVATSVGAEGLGVVDGQHMRVADGAEAFAAAIVELMEAPLHRHAIAVAGQQLVAANFSWEAKTAALLRDLRGFVAAYRVPTAAPAAGGAR